MIKLTREQRVALKKVFATTGVVTPSQVGLNEDEVRKDFKMYPKKAGEKTAMEMKPVPKPPGGGGSSTKKKGQQGQGRPKTSKDSTKRATKKFTPRGKAVVTTWARAALEAISQFLNQDLLEYFDKKNMRSLSAEETRIAEEMKFGVLCQMEPLSEINEAALLGSLTQQIPSNVKEGYQALTVGTQAELNRRLTLDEERHLQAYLYAELSGVDEDDED